MFIHLGQVDEAGHTSYWGSPKYYDAVKNIDNFFFFNFQLFDYFRLSIIQRYQNTTSDSILHQLHQNRGNY